MKKSKQIAVLGLLSALSVVLMFLGSVISVLSYIMPLISGLLMIIAVENISKKSAWVTYICVSILSVFLLTDKECALFYVSFFGYYPIIKSSIDKIKNKILLWIVRAVIFNVGIILNQLVCVYVFCIPFDNFLGGWGIVLLLVLANVLFVMYEKLLSMLILLYQKKYKSKFSNLFRQ